MHFPYIDIHTHTADIDGEVLALKNCFLYEIEKPKGYFTCGLHPWHLDKINIDAEIDKIVCYANNANMLGIGECGLDVYANTPMDVQFDAFQRLVSATAHLKKPYIIHCVKAYNPLLSFIKKEGGKLAFLFHKFNSSLQMANDLITAGCFLSFHGGHLIKGKTKGIINVINKDCFFLETDDGGFDIKYTYQIAAKILNTHEDELKRIQYNNFKRLFGNVSG